ncbi:AAA family ATPase [Methylibium petroleiphilum]|nr:ATP-binding protein [Methylibium petroleiphilum]
MKIELTAPLANDLVAASPSDERAVRRASMYDKNAFTIDHEALSRAALDALYEIAKKHGERGLMMQLTSLRNVLAAPATSKLGNLKALEPGLIAYLQHECIDGWLYRYGVGGEAVPFLVTSVEFQPADPRNERPAYVKVGYCWNAMGGFHQEQMRFELSDVQGKTIPEVLAKYQFVHESPELKEAYSAHLARYLELRDLHGKQFRCTGLAITAERYGRSDYKAAGARMVNDEDTVPRKDYRVGFSGSVRLRASMEDDEVFSTVPMHPFIFMYDLHRHMHAWVHASKVEIYKYDKSVGAKLVLPEVHRDLVDVLTQDMDVLVEDIVEGKSGGTIVLCKGGPGLGKTLTAEVYSEIAERPLYRVHSGQLGVEAAALEKQLGTVLDRAKRWGAILLIDEGDVYVRARGNDLDHNAVVAVFLRVLETFDGLLFMTTNRGDEIDDAIVSRCIAVIRYEKPNEEDCKRLWRILSTQFGAELSDQLIDELVASFGCLAGRDIKGLLKLTVKFCRRRNEPFSVETFRRCGQFRGLV